MRTEVPGMFLARRHRTLLRAGANARCRGGREDIERRGEGWAAGARVPVATSGAALGGNVDA